MDQDTDTRVGMLGALSQGGWGPAAVLSLGVWLHAADGLMATTIMPNAVEDIGGLAYIYWTIALYELGSIVAGAATGLLVMRFGLRPAMSVAALIYAAGCVASAVAPDMAAMLAGRLVQGFGGGWMVALSHVGVTRLYPARLWPGLIALISAVWGVSSLVGPTIGGAFATAGLWRGAFWAFAAQAVVLAALIPLALRPVPPAAGEAGSLPWRRLGVFAAGVLLLLTAGVCDNPLEALAMATLGLAVLAFAFRLEDRSPRRMFPVRTLDWRTPWGPGFVTILLLSMCTISFGIYGPLFMQRMFGATPLAAGLLLALESVSWSVAAVTLAGAGRVLEAHLIRWGTAAIVAGTAGFAVTMPSGPLLALVPWAILQGAGFGAAWAFIMRRIVERVAEDDRERAASSVPTFQRLGYALGAAMAGIVVNGTGIAEATTVEAFRVPAFWAFAAFVPLGGIGILAAWRLAGPTEQGR